MISPELLRRYPYFTAGGDDALKAIAMNAVEVEVAKGEVLFEEGDSADHLYIVTGGQLDLALTLASGDRVIVETMVAGDLLGWSAMANESRRRAACQAREPARLIGIDGGALRTLCDGNCRLGYGLVNEVNKALTRRLDGAWVQVAAQKP